MLLKDMTWPEVKALNWTDKIAVLPLGSFEQHGPHLPFTTDSDLAGAVAHGIEAERPGKIVLLPVLWPGHSTHHLHFPGTLSVTQQHYISMILNLVQSIAGMGATRIFLLNGHGGNEIPVKAALREIKSELPPPQPQVVFASYWSLAANSMREIRESEMGGMGHACEMETSIMLHLFPDRVHMERAKPDGAGHQESPYRRTDMQYSRPVYFVNEFHEVTSNGTIGHPQLATADKGERFLKAIIKDVIAFTDEFLTWD